jgi:hypothetical protein
LKTPLKELKRILTRTRRKVIQRKMITRELL